MKVLLTIFLVLLSISTSQAEVVRGKLSSSPLPRYIPRGGVDLKRNKKPTLSTIPIERLSIKPKVPIKKGQVLLPKIFLKDNYKLLEGLALLNNKGQAKNSMSIAESIEEEFNDIMDTVDSMEEPEGIKFVREESMDEAEDEMIISTFLGKDFEVEMLDSRSE